MTIDRLFKVFTVLSLSMTSALLLSPPGYAAKGYALLRGFWQCQEKGKQTTLEFQSKSQLIYNGQPANYQLLPNAFQVIEDSGPPNYFYQYLEGTLIIFSPDGSMTYCQKAKKPPVQAQRPAQPQTTVQEGTLPQGTISLIYQNDKHTNYRHKVHCCGSEYFFNDKLYSVKYIYR